VAGCCILLFIAALSMTSLIASRFALPRQGTRIIQLAAADDVQGS
jgi:hypothetical protein